jgi:hypothetical protein
MYFSVSATDDASNIDYIGCLVQQWQLVPNDNNIGERDIGCSNWSG